MIIHFLLTAALFPYPLDGIYERLLQFVPEKFYYKANVD